MVLRHEGGWSDHPQDPGGATMQGITLANYRRFVKPNATKADLRKITPEVVAQVYRQQYWEPIRGDDLPAGLDFAMFDYAVNSGTGRAPKVLQRILGVPVDGKIGPKTLAAIKNHSVNSLIDALCDERMAFLRRLKTFPTFGRGWTRRVSEVRAKAKRML
jgi:lysozyme family protein